VFVPWIVTVLGAPRTSLKTVLARKPPAEYPADAPRNVGVEQRASNVAEVHLPRAAVDVDAEALALRVLIAVVLDHEVEVEQTEHVAPIDAHVSKVRKPLVALPAVVAELERFTVAGHFVLVHRKPPVSADRHLVDELLPQPPGQTKTNLRLGGNTAQA
jgi:hypothetical protein